MKAGILLLARMGATRLPGKLLKEVMGRPILEYQIERLRTATLPSQIILCTTQLSEDVVLVEVAERNGLSTFRGNIEDVVDRMLQAAYQHHLDFVISIGGDDVLCDPIQVDRIISHFQQTNADFIQCDDLPVGATPFGVKTTALAHLSQIKTGGTDGWERYFEEFNVFEVSNLTPQDETLRRPEMRMTLDYPDDFLFFKKVFKSLYSQNNPFTLRDVIKLVDARPDIAKFSRARAEDWQTKHNSFNISINN